MLGRCLELGKETPLLMPYVLLEELEGISDRDSQPEIVKGKAYEVLKTAQEVIVAGDRIAIALRPSAGLWKFVKVDPKTLNVKDIDVSSYLAIKEELSPDGMQPAFNAWQGSLITHHHRQILFAPISNEQCM